MAKQTATRSESTTTHETRVLDEGSDPPIDRSNRITLAVLEETFAAQRARGYDPYNTAATVHLQVVERRKRKHRRD